MANPTPKTKHLKATQWKAGQSGNNNGRPRGSRNLSSVIRDLMEDENFEQKLKDGSTFKGMPAEAIARTMIAKALKGDVKAFDLLARFGYGTHVDVTSDYKALPTPITALPLNVNLPERNS